MKIGVLIKQVADVGSVRIDSRTGEPNIGGKPVMNIGDAHALSEAIDLREATGGEVIAVGLGPKSARDALVEALATGADGALHIACEETDHLNSLSTARTIAEAVRGEGFDVLFAGHKAADYGTGQVGIQIAEYLRIHHLSNVTVVIAEGESLHVTRDADGFPEEIDAETPILLALSPREDAPKRHPSLRGMMQAKRKPVREVEATIPLTNELAWSKPMAQRVSADRILLEGEPANEAAAKLAAWLRAHRLVG